MTDLLLDVPESVPKWKELAERHGIRYWRDRDRRGDKICLARHYGEPDSFGIEPMRTIQANTEREAVVTLIHRLRLEGWQDVSVN